MTKPVLETTVPDSTTHEPPSEPAQDLPTPATDLPTNQATGESENPQVPSLVRTDDPSNADVEITRTGYIKPGRPTVLAKCPAKEQLLDHGRLRWMLPTMLI